MWLAIQTPSRSQVRTQYICMSNTDCTTHLLRLPGIYCTLWTSTSWRNIMVRYYTCISLPLTFVSLHPFPFSVVHILVCKVDKYWLLFYSLPRTTQQTTTSMKVDCTFFLTHSIIHFYCSVCFPFYYSYRNYWIYSNCCHSNFICNTCCNCFTKMYQQI